MCGIRVETDSSGDSTTYAGAVGAKGNGVSFDRTAANKNLAEKVREQSTSVNSEKPKESVTVIDSVQREATEVDNLNDDSSRSSSHGSRKTGDGKFRKRLSKRNNRNANAKQCSPYLQQSTLLPPKSRPVSAMKKKGVTHPKHPRAVEHCGDGNDNQSSPKVQDQSLTQTTDCTEPIALPVTEEGEATSIENSTQMREKAIEQTRKTKESAHATINEQQYLANCYKNEPAACETAHESQDNNTISTDTQSSRGLEGIDVQQDRYHRKLITHSLLSELVGEERKVLSDFVSEISRVRLGGYKLLFPVDNKYAQYRRYFESERPNNAMLSRYMFALLHHKDIITLKYENITAPDASRQPKDDFMKDYSLRPAQAIDDNKKSISYERQSPLYEDSNFKRKPVMAVDNREDDSDMVQTATAPIVGTPKSLLQNRPLSRAGGKTQTSKIFRVDSTNKISAKEALGDLQVTRVEASVSIETLNNKWARSIGKSSNHGERNSNNLYAII